MGQVCPRGRCIDVRAETHRKSTAGDVFADGDGQFLKGAL